MSRSYHAHPNHGPPWPDPTGYDSQSGSLCPEWELLSNRAPAHQYLSSTPSESFDAVPNDFPKTYLIAQRSTPVLYAPSYYPPEQQQQTFAPTFRYPSNQQLSEARYHSGSDQTHGGFYNRALPSSGSADVSVSPPLDVPEGGMSQRPPYYPSHADLHIPPTSSDLRSPHFVYSPASSPSQCQFPSFPACPTGNSPSRGAVPIVSAPNTHYQQSMAMSHASLDHAIPSSRGITQLPYALPTAPSLVLYDVPETPEQTFKKRRKRADPRQVDALNRTYARTAFPSAEEREQIARNLDMSPRRVKNWFQNKRQSSRRAERNPVNPPITQSTVTFPAEIPPAVVRLYGAPAAASPIGETLYRSGLPPPAMTRMRTGQSPPPPGGRPLADIPGGSWPGHSRRF